MWLIVAAFSFLAMKKILITSHHNEAEAEKFFGYPSVIVQDYKVFPFHAEGAIPVIVPAIEFTTAELREMVRMVDMVVLTGGDDVDTKLYGEEVKHPTIKCYSYRDRIEFNLLEAAILENKPVFGICRGMQIINVFFGGSLYQNLHHDYESNSTLQHREPDSEKKKLSHEIQVEPDSFLSRIYGDSACIWVTSLHNQSVKKLGKGFKISATSTDGIIEAIEHEEYQIFGVQWHPEHSYKDDPNSQKLIEAVVKM